jgi:hypothetical protein
MEGVLKARRGGGCEKRPGIWTEDDETDAEGDSKRKTIAQRDARAQAGQKSLKEVAVEA